MTGSKLRYDQIKYISSIIGYTAKRSQKSCGHQVLLIQYYKKK